MQTVDEETRPDLTFETRFRLTPHQRDRWERFFGATPGTRPPLTYYARPGVEALRRIVASLGFDSCLHLQSTARYCAPAVSVPQHLSLRVELAHVLPLAPTRAGLVVDVEVSTGEGERLQAVREVFGVFGLDEGWWDGVVPATLLAMSAPASTVLLRRPPRRTGEISRASIGIPTDLGVRYGRLSGDMNPHVTPAGAARAGFRRPFLQGLCTANLVVTELTRRGTLERFSVLFARPVEVGQSVELLLHDDGFELRDETGRLVAFGEHRWCSSVVTSRLDGASERVEAKAPSGR